MGPEKAGATRRSHASPCVHPLSRCPARHKSRAAQNDASASSGPLATDASQVALPRKQSPQVPIVRRLPIPNTRSAIFMTAVSEESPILNVLTAVGRPRRCSPRPAPRGAVSPIRLHPMHRRLLILPLLTALSACRQDDAGPELNSGSAETENATNATAARWSLPWYYLGGPVCLVGGSGPDRNELIYHLLELADQDSTEFKRVLEDDGRGPNEDPAIPLIRRIQRIVNNSGTRYRWNDPWPSGLAVRVVRRDLTDQDTAEPLPTLMQETVLGPGILELPWPFPNDDPDSVGALELAADSLDVVIPTDTAPPGANSFYLYRLLFVADSLLMLQQNRPSAPPNDMDLRRAILAQVRRGHPEFKSPLNAPFPESLLISGKRNWWTDSTRVRFAPASGTHLELGWQRPPSLDPNPDPSLLRTVFFAKWPCGALSRPDE